MHVQLVGTFKLVDAEGVDRSPRGAKACALIALICSVPERRRSRRWLEARLWSGRDSGQASGSLRQTLYEIRRALGPHASLLSASRDIVTLDGVLTDLEADPGGTARAIAAGREFLEGIDIKDEAFEEWLTAERARYSPPEQVSRPSVGSDSRRLPILVQVADFGGGAAAFLPTALASEITRLISDLAEVEIYQIAPGKTAIVAPVRGLRITIESARFDEEIHLVATITNIAHRRVAWTRRARFPRVLAQALESGDFARLTFEAAEAAHAALSLAVEPDSASWAQGRQAQAVRALFTFDRAQLQRADRLLKESTEVMPSARGWAWRAFLQQTLIIERVSTDFEATKGEAELFARRALSSPEPNSTVLALVSQLSAMIALDASAALTTAQEAVAINPLNPYAQYALAAAYLRAGNFNEARRHGHIASDTSANAHNGFFFKGIMALIALASGDIGGCVTQYEAIAHRVPQFRAPLRGLVVLSLAQGDHVRAAKYIDMLTKAEEGFTLDRLLNDDKYPGVTLRSMGFLKAASQRL